MTRNKVTQIARIADNIQMDIARIHQQALTALEEIAKVEITFANEQHIEKIIHQLNQILLAAIPYTPHKETDGPTHR